MVAERPTCVSCNIHQADCLYQVADKNKGRYCMVPLCNPCVDTYDIFRVAGGSTILGEDFLPEWLEDRDP